MKIACPSVRLGLFAALLLSSTTALATSYSVQGYSLPGYEVTNFWGINNSGAVVGTAYVTSGAPSVAFTFSSGSYAVLDGPAGNVSAGATGVSDAGTVVGFYTNASSQGYGFIYESGAYTDFSIAGAESTILRGISSGGRYLAGTYSDLNNFSNGFIYDRSMGALWTIDNAIVQGVNNAGLAVGSTLLPDRHPFTHDFGADLTTSYAPSSDRYRGINDLGIITGFGTDESFNNFAFVGPAGSVDPLPALSPTFSIGYGINNDGWVVGFYGADPDAIAQNGFIARPVPEPATFGLALAGLVLLGLRGRTMPEHV